MVDKEELIEAERKLFEADAEVYGFDVTRQQCVAPEPWSEYVNAETGHRWGGWLVAQSLAADKIFELVELLRLCRYCMLIGDKQTDWAHIIAEIDKKV